MDLVNNVGVFYLMSFFQSALFAYFISEYLSCENKRQRFLKIFGVFCFVNLLAAIFYQYVLMKSLIMGILFIVSLFTCFKEYGYFKKIIAYMMLLTLAFFSEMLVNSIFYWIHGYLDYTRISQIEFIGWQLGVDCFLFLLSTFVLNYMKLKNSLDKIENVIFILLMSSQILFIYAAMIDLIDKSFSNFIGNLFYFLIFIFMIISHICLIFILIKNHERKVKEITMIKIRSEYKKQLDKYLIMEDKDIRLLRHDIINFLEERNTKVK